MNETMDIDQFHAKMNTEFYAALTDRMRQEDPYSNVMIRPAQQGGYDVRIVSRGRHQDFHVQYCFTTFRPYWLAVYEV